jgi:regulator of protease activity HflC (stomatin/prohibitin superfamily)
MERAMAKQAEAERERRAMIIASQGELTASENLSKAANTLSQNPGALHLRTLQTIRDIASDPSEKIVLFVPSDLGDVAKQLTGKK